MTVLLRLGALAVNLAVAAGVPLLLGLGWASAVAVAAAFFLAVRWACGRAPAGEPADAEVTAAAEHTASRMGAPAPRSVRSVQGWTAAAVSRGRGGYVLLIGAEVPAAHRGALLAHEIAHVVEGDLAWEPLTDGPARLLLPAVRRLPPLGVAVFPFFLLGTPLARRTELQADRRAARADPSYLSVMKEVMKESDGRVSFLYPTVAQRLRASARKS
jgi:hypothetical protein